MKNVDQTKQQVKETAESAKPWVEKIARFGYATKGVVYLTLGVLAIQAAIGTHSANVDTRDALVEIIYQPFGLILLIIVGAGLVGYSLWKLVQAFIDPEDEAGRGNGLLTRAGKIVPGLGYGFLAVNAFQIVLGSRHDSSEATETLVSILLAQPFGKWVVIVVGIVVGIVGLGQLYKVYSADFLKKIDTINMQQKIFSGSKWLGRLGYLTRGIVYLLIGYLIITAAINYNPEQAGGLGDALASIAAQPYGPWLLALIATGLLFYGVFMLITARFRDIRL